MSTTMSPPVEMFRREGRSGIGICLSGGGFRASLFHLGALRRLHELGILQQARWISSVSGGSILAGHLAQCQVDSGRDGKLDFGDWQLAVSDPFRAFAACDLRSWPVIRNCAWNWFAPGPLLKSLERRYRRRVTRLGLRELPVLPEYVLCATDLAFGVNWEFSRTHVGSYQAGYLDLAGSSTAVQDMTVARAITASACFPPLFGPMRAGLDPDALAHGEFKGSNRDELIRTLVLSDGGIYDNMATEPVWKKAATVLVSDCGAPFDYSDGKQPWRMLLRYTSVVSRQTQALRIRILNTVWKSPLGERAYDGTRWDLASGNPDASSSSTRGYTASIAKSCIATIRTDLDNFSNAEMSILENHGYFNADYRIRQDLPELIAQQARPMAVPYPQWVDDEKVKAALVDSSKRFVLARLRKGLFG
ncbi:MAG TPA: patatin-like phospholipase family protein [Steroidobacteraceae bacterium]|nr:patatin-like phospholipase family protein [Steroidobacteraceae bacterium]